jgi:hypothetical protein
VRQVLHRRLSILIPIALGILVSGCATFSDNNAIARVNDIELSQDDFEQQLTDLGVSDQDVVPLDPARAEITRWIQAALIDQDQIAVLYDAGPATSGVVCLQAIVVEDSAAASATVSELEGGTSFEDVFQAANIDPSIAGDLGAVPCIGRADLENPESVPLIDAALQLSTSSPIGVSPLVGADGEEVAWAVIVLRPFDQLGFEDIDVVTASVDVSSELADADIYVDPRYGTFDKSTAQVVGLG